MLMICEDKVRDELEGRVKQGSKNQGHHMIEIN